MNEWKLTAHARERIRQRFGYEDETKADEWVNEQMKEARYTGSQGHKLVYATKEAQIIVDPKPRKVITVKIAADANKFFKLFANKVEKEAKKLLTVKERAFRKAEIDVAEKTLNYLKARNPNIKAKLAEEKAKAIDEREKINVEICQIKEGAKIYGVEL